MNNFFLNKSKGEVLLSLAHFGLQFKIPKTILINVSDWKKSKELEYEKIIKKFNLKLNVAIRSSSRNEDNENVSNAGKYLSYLNIKLNKKKLFFNCVDNVIQSYSKKFRSNDQILIQEMVDNINSSGVIFTRDIETGANYYVINYDDVTGKTNTVTSGQGHYSNRILYIHKQDRNNIKSKRFKKLINFTKKLEKKIGSNSLDIEFAINNKLQIYLLQVRPISTSSKWNIADNIKINSKIKIFEKKLAKLFEPKKNIVGKNTIYGNMPDWNPVEIIGKYPSPLSISLYRYLITDNIWAKARFIMGYKNLTKHKLMHMICGQPYIDTRLSLNSFLPLNLNQNVSRKIVNHGINLLKKFPYFHDKIEFEISKPSFCFSSEKKINKLFKKVLTQNEKLHLLNQIKNLTIKVIEENGKFSIDYCSRKIDDLNFEFNNYDIKKPIEINALLKKCRDFGTLNFSILARHGFIAKSFINSLIEKKIFKEKQIDLFEQNLNSITSNMLEDSHLVSVKRMSKVIFMKKYGHLRPGTYDLTSKRFDQMKNFRFSKIKKNNENFKISSIQKKKIDILLHKNNFTISTNEFINYLKKSLILREYSKFVFTKYLSLVLEKIALIGKKNNISRADISNLDIKFFIRKKNITNNKKTIYNLIKKKKKEFDVYKKIKLPALILDKSNLRVIPFQVNLPNFVTRKKIDGTFLNLNKFNNQKQLDNKIVFIENADPGYDWIFAHKIKALVTKFGGINSHMAIRCSELSIPAVIGCGEQIYSDLTKFNNKHIFIDCSSSLIYSN